MELRDGNPFRKSQLSHSGECRKEVLKNKVDFYAQLCGISIIGLVSTPSSV